MKIYIIKTDKGCFISDIMKFDGYDYNYHQFKLKNMFFDGKSPKPSNFANWFFIDNYPQKITQFISQPDINKRYEIKDEDMISQKIPKVIKDEEKDNYEESILGLYNYKSDKQPDKETILEVELIEILEIKNFEFPKEINYKIMQKDGWGYKEKIITRKDLNHQIIDRIIFPEVVLPNTPCSISSVNLYSIIRQHIKENIDTKLAKITSDYDFCFTVKKIVPLIEPRKFTYTNIFGRTKRERNKIRYGVQEYKEIEIFEMTHDRENYRSYTPIGTLSANNENELKEKIDYMLKGLISVINRPLSLCEYCNGTGYTEEIKRIEHKDLI